MPDDLDVLQFLLCFVFGVGVFVVEGGARGQALGDIAVSMDFGLEGGLPAFIGPFPDLLPIEKVLAWAGAVRVLLTLLILVEWRGLCPHFLLPGLALPLYILQELLSLILPVIVGRPWSLDAPDAISFDF